MDFLAPEAESGLQSEAELNVWVGDQVEFGLIQDLSL